MTFDVLGVSSLLGVDVHILYLSHTTLLASFEVKLLYCCLNVTEDFNKIYENLCELWVWFISEQLALSEETGSSSNNVLSEYIWIGLAVVVL